VSEFGAYLRSVGVITHFANMRTLKTACGLEIQEWVENGPIRVLNSKRKPSAITNVRSAVECRQCIRILKRRKKLGK